MLRFSIILSMLCISICANAQFDAIKNANASNSLRTKYLSFIEGKGYSPEIDNDGDIFFLYKSKRYYITFDQKDPKFFRMARIANLMLNNKSDITLAEKICHEVTRDVKVTKVYWSNDQIWASSELILSNEDGYKQIFDRTLRFTELAYNKFVEKWKERSN